MPYRGVLAGIVGALLLRNRWGLSEREIVVGQYGTGMFTPLELVYNELYTDVTTKVDYEATKLASYRLIAAVDSSPVPAMWLAADDVGTQVSYCVANGADGPAQRWDAGDAAVPPFDPLPVPGW